MSWHDFLLILLGGASGAFLLALLVSLLAWRAPIRTGFDVDRDV